MNKTSHLLLILLLKKQQQRFATNMAETSQTYGNRQPDAIDSKENTLNELLKELKLLEQNKSKSTLLSQGIISNSIDDVNSNKHIHGWSNAIWALLECIFQFNRKSSG